MMDAKTTGEMLSTFSTKFDPPNEMFVCMDKTGCYHVSWDETQHRGKMAALGISDERRYATTTLPDARSRTTNSTWLHLENGWTLSMGDDEQALCSIGAWPSVFDDADLPVDAWFQFASGAMTERCWNMAAIRRAMLEVAAAKPPVISK